jgi:hypothetical protein
MWQGGENVAGTVVTVSTQKTVPDTFAPTTSIPQIGWRVNMLIKFSSSRSSGAAASR